MPAYIFGRKQFFRAEIAVKCFGRQEGIKHVSVWDGNIEDRQRSSALQIQAKLRNSCLKASFLHFQAVKLCL